jgi:hypothetical protein
MYEWVITIATVILAFITNARISYKLGERWKIYDKPDSDFPIFEAFSACLAAVLFYFISCAGFDNFNMMGGLIVAAATIPISGFVWVFIVGGNKVIERILNGLLKKVD